MAESQHTFYALRAIIGGTSGLDLPHLELGTLAEAEAFCEGYGFDWSVPSHRRELEDIRAEALAFIDERLLEPGETMPGSLRAESDVRRLMMAASDPVADVEQAWACAVLRVMHIVAHCGSLLEDRYGADIRAQILDRFRPHLGPDPEHPQRLGPDIPLVAFEVKAAKSRQSTVLKLLHKAENVAADVFDRIGVRIVTESVADALMVVRYLRVHNVIVFVNIKPTRSRNTLVDLDALGPDLATLDVGRLAQVVASAPAVDAKGGANRFSARSYRSIQFTSRQLVRSQGLRFFFPFEVQILDRASWQATEDGDASHDAYRRRQRQAVRARVLGSLSR